MSTRTSSTPVTITALAPTHPLRAHLSAASLATLAAGRLPAEMVCGYGSKEPTALRYAGMAWTLAGVTWQAA